MIKVEHLFKSFDDKPVLKDINAEFENGKVNLIIGQSGSGKTVFMNNIVGLLTPTSGNIFYDERDFVNMSMIFQSAALFDSLSVLDNVMFPLNMFSYKSYEDRKKRAEYCLERVNLAGTGNKFPKELSGGMQKRVAIARAIALEPKYLFCDEPNSGLDPKTSIVIDELIQGITHEDNITTIVNTHDMNSVMGIGEKIIFICEGRAEWQGSNQEIMDANNRRLDDFIFASDILRQVKLAHDEAKKQ